LPEPSIASATTACMPWTCHSPRRSSLSPAGDQA
jgi:hypothetical protein